MSCVQWVLLGVQWWVLSSAWIIPPGVTYERERERADVHDEMLMTSPHRQPLDDGGVIRRARER